MFLYSNFVMKNIKDIINATSEISENDKYFWSYQYNLAKEFIVPYLKKNNIFKSGDAVFEIGCAEGGVLSAFAEAGASLSIGTDIAEYRLDTGKKICQIVNLPIEFLANDIINNEPPDFLLQKADLVILRDVIEHLDDQEKALLNIKKLMKPAGFLYITFPPYYSPFGGHQHTLHNFWSKVPYIHLLPKSIFHKLISSGRLPDITEVKRLKEIKLTVRKFILLAKKIGFHIIKADYFLIRPVYKMKFGLPSLKITPFAIFPFIRELFCFEASYILKNNDV